MTRPRLASGRRRLRQDHTVNAPKLAANAPIIHVDRQPLWLRLSRAALGWGAVALVLTVAVYAVLAATVMVVMRAGDRHVVVLRNAYPVGQVPAGAYVYVSSAPVDYSHTGKLKQATVGVPAGSVVQIVAGPTGQVATDNNGYITVDGARTPYQGQVTPRRLARQYVAICIVGACEPGQAVLVGQDTVIGAAKGYLTLTGRKPISPEPGR